MAVNRLTLRYLVVICLGMVARHDCRAAIPPTPF